jgi:outer membrane protein OmpA-like peptidoglycan-associated protein
MKRIDHSTFAVRALALIAIGIACVGCCDKEQKQISYLTQQNTELAQKNKEVNAELATARSREAQFAVLMDSKDMQLTALETENKDLKAKRGGGPVGPPPPVGPGDGTVLYSETVGSDVLFEAGKAALTANGKARLDTIAATLRSRYPGMTVRVMGYTDSDPIVKTKNLWKDNLDLSANRAMEVTRHLWSKGVSAEHVETVAMGATHFVGANTTKAGKAGNRRVEIVVVKR